MAGRQTIELDTSFTSLLSLLTKASGHRQVGIMGGTHAGKKGPLTELLRKMKYLYVWSLFMLCRHDRVTCIRTPRRSYQTDTLMQKHVHRAVPLPPSLRRLTTSTVWQAM